MNDTFRLFEKIPEVHMLKGAITAMYRLQIRNAGCVRFGRSGPGACQQDHVYFRPTLEHRVEAKVRKSPPTLPFSFQQSRGAPHQNH